MIITRKIQIYVAEQDRDAKKEYIHTLYTWRDSVRRAANIVVAHKFCQENIKDFVYIKDEIKEKFYIKDILNEGKGNSEQNTTYRVLSELLKGKVPADIYSCLNQIVVNTYKETRKDMYTGKASLRTYKNNIPIPFSAKALNFKWSDKRYEFTLFGIPMATRLGADLSNNKHIIERCLDTNSEYKLCSSSIQINDKLGKMFLLMCVDIPKQKVRLDKDKCLYAMLSVEKPIVFRISESADEKIDTTLAAFAADKMFSIGDKEEFLYRRLQIQAALHRAQIAARYNKGGKGRKRKLQSTEHFFEKEKGYVDSRLHLYSKMLIDHAIRSRCAKIILINQKQNEEEAKNTPFLLRNWSYYGLIQKITYKAAKYNIIVEEK
jgi:hypothetical protein